MQDANITDYNYYLSISPTDFEAQDKHDEKSLSPQSDINATPSTDVSNRHQSTKPLIQTPKIGDSYIPKPNQNMSSKVPAMVDNHILNQLLTGLKELKASISQQTTQICKILSKQYEQEKAIKDIQSTISESSKVLTKIETTHSAALIDKVSSTNNILATKLSTIDSTLQQLQKSVQSTTPHNDSTLTVSKWATPPTIQPNEESTPKTISYTQKGSSNRQHAPRPDKESRKPSTHKLIHKGCETIIIGDTTCRTILPSKRNLLAVRTYAGITINELSREINDMPTLNSVRDICLQVGTHDLKPNTADNDIARLVDEYRNLIEITKQYFQMRT